jgi:hypothetical protein
MVPTPLPPASGRSIPETSARNEALSSGVSWGAVIAGAFVAAALSLALLALGTGIGLSAVSPWANVGASASAVGWTAIVWVVLMQLIASSMGGYLAGRLRTKWVNVHTHEVYFRDTAHGFLVWAVALVITAAFLTSAAAAVIGGAERAGVAAASPSNATPSPSDLEPNAYVVETLLRATPYTDDRDTASARAEVGLIVANDLRHGSLAPADRAYLAQIVAIKTGASQSDAERRVDEAYATAAQMADSARKAVAHSMYWMFLALLIGAFCASVAATVGGNQRDRMAAM